MKKFRLFALILALPFLTCCRGHITMGLYLNADKYLVGNQVYEGTVSKIDVDWISGQVTLNPSYEVNGVEIAEENNLDEKSKVHSYFVDGVIYLKFMASGHRAVIDEKDKHVLLTYNPSAIEDINIHLTSGKLVGTTIAAINDIDIGLTSGRVEIDSLNAKKVKIDVTSGYTLVNEIKSEELTATMTSGTIITKNVDTKTYSGHSTSGTLETSFTNLETGDIHFTSGTLKLTMPQSGGKVIVDKTSGSVTTNRECTIEGSTYKFGEGTAVINVGMTSGRIVID